MPHQVVRASRIALALLVVGLVYSLQYLNASNVSIWPQPWGARFEGLSYLPVTGPGLARRALGTVSPVLFFPLGTLVRHLPAPPNTPFSRAVCGALFPFPFAFSNLTLARLNFVVFAAYNSVPWLAAIWALIAFSRRSNRA